MLKKPLLTDAELDAVSCLKDGAENYASVLTLPKQVTESPITLGDGHEIQTTVPAPNCLTGRIVSFRVLTLADAVKPVYSVNVEYERESSLGAGIGYEPGDSFGVYPELDEGTVAWLCSRLRLDQDRLLSMTSSSPGVLKAIFPLKGSQEFIACTAQELLARLDFAGFPKKSQLRALADCCPLGSDDGWQLAFLSSQQGASAYGRLRDEKFCVLDALAACGSLAPNLADVLRIVGPLQPRYYSCCSVDDGVGAKASFDFVFNVAEWDGGRKGVASGWLERKLLSGCYSGSLLPLVPRSIAHFRLPMPAQAAYRVLMIGAGTGVAPFVGFLRQKQRLGWCSLQTCLFFGFRNDSDFLFKDELLAMKLDGTLNFFIESRSRDACTAKRHVQDSLIEQQEFVCRWLNGTDTFIYICGDELTMIKGVNDALQSILRTVDGKTDKEAEAHLSCMAKERRILRDIWI